MDISMFVAFFNDGKFMGFAVKSSLSNCARGKFGTFRDSRKIVPIPIVLEVWLNDDSTDNLQDLSDMLHNLTDNHPDFTSLSVRLHVLR